MQVKCFTPNTESKIKGHPVKGFSADVRPKRKGLAVFKLGINAVDSVKSLWVLDEIRIM